MMALIVACHYPLQFNPARKAVLSLLDEACNKPGEKSNNGAQFDSDINNNSSDDGIDDSHNIDRDTSHSDCSRYYSKVHLIAGENSTYYLVTVALLLFTLIIALSFSDLGVALSIVGATGAL